MSMTRGRKLPPAGGLSGVDHQHGANMKTVYAGEWIEMGNIMNKNVPGHTPCALCGNSSSGRAWFSIKTKAVRCMICFDAVAYERTPEGRGYHRGQIAIPT